MATRAQRNNDSLAAAIALLIHNQAQFVAELAETRKAFAKMQQDLDAMRAILARHETILEGMAETIREKT